MRQRRRHAGQNHQANRLKNRPKSFLPERRFEIHRSGQGKQEEPSHEFLHLQPTGGLTIRR